MGFPARQHVQRLQVQRRREDRAEPVESGLKLQLEARLQIGTGIPF